MFETYSPSGRFSMMFLPGLLVGILATIVLAFVYHLGLYWIPLIYINFLLTLIVGVAVGFITAAIIRFGKVRNTAVSYMIMLLLAATVIGAKFGFQYMQARSELASMLQNFDPKDVAKDGRELTAEQMVEFRKVVLDEYTFVDHIQQRVESGWQVGKAGQANNGNAVSGFMVYLVWAIEAITVLYIASTSTATAVKQPFSEKMGRWASEDEVVMTLPITSDEMVTQIKAANSVDDLLKLPVPTSNQSATLATYTVHSIPGVDEEDAYLTVDLHTHTTNKKGETQIKTKTLVRNAIITSEQRAQLKQNAEVMNEAFAAYQASRAGTPGGEAPAV